MKRVKPLPYKTIIKIVDHGNGKVEAINVGDLSPVQYESIMVNLAMSVVRQNEAGRIYEAMEGQTQIVNPNTGKPMVSGKRENFEVVKKEG